MKLLGWRQELRHDGYVLTALDGDGRVRVSDRHTPLRAAGELLREAAAELGMGAAVTVERRARRLSREGEPYALATLSARDRAGVLAVVYADDWYRRIWGTASAGGAGALRAVVESLADDGSLGLGAARVRRPWYVPPAGWHGVARGLVTDWLAPAFPRDPAILTVFPTWPADMAASERGVIEAPDAGQVVAESPLTVAGLSGRLREIRACFDGEIMMVHHAELGDGNTDIHVRLESRPDTVQLHGATLRRLLATLEPPARANRHDLLAHWAA